MPSISVVIRRFVDEHQPGSVECALVDAAGQEHRFIKKVPVVTLEDLRSSSIYPAAGEIAREVLAEWTDDTGRALSRITTDTPWGIASTAELTEFVVESWRVTRS